MPRILAVVVALTTLLLPAFAVAQDSKILARINDLIEREKALDKVRVALVRAPPSAVEDALQLQVAELRDGIAQNQAMFDALTQAVDQGNAYTGPTHWAEIARDPERASALRALYSRVISDSHAVLAPVASQLAAMQEQRFKERDDAGIAWQRAFFEMHAALGDLERSSAPLSVKSVSIVDHHGQGHMFAAEWTLTGEARAEAAIYGLEQMLSGTRDSLARLRPQLSDMADRQYRAGRRWNRLLQMAIDRQLDRAIVDTIVSIAADAIEIGYATATAGAWTFARFGYAAMDAAIRGAAYRSTARDASSAFQDLGADHISDALKKTIRERIASDINSGTPIDVHRLLHGAPPPPTLPDPTPFIDFLADGGWEAAQSVVSGLIGTFESLGREHLAGELMERGEGSAGLLARAYLALTPREIWKGDWSLLDQLKKHQEVSEVLADEAKALTLTAALMVGTRVVSGATKLWLESGEYSDADLARMLAAGELEMFVLAEAYRELRALYDVQSLYEPIIAANLDMVRQGLTEGGHRVFATLDGTEIDPKVETGLGEGEVGGVLEFVVDVEGGSGPFRVEVVSDNGTVLTETTAEAGTPRVSLSLAADALRHNAGNDGGVVQLDVRIHPVGQSVIDSDPATPARIDRTALGGGGSSLKWLGVESGPDSYRFAAYAPAVTQTDAHIVMSPFEGNWEVTHYGYPTRGEKLVGHFSIYRPWYSGCAGELTDNCEFELQQDASAPLSVGIYGNFASSHSIEENGNALVVGHPYYYLGTWGSRSEVTLQGSAMAGTWTSRDNGVEPGTEFWLKTQPEVRELVLTGNVESRVQVGSNQLATVELDYNADYWTRGNSMRGNRPTIYISLLGNEMWGAHRLAFRDTPGLEIITVTPIWREGTEQVAPNMLGVTAEVILWPGTTPGKHTIWLEDKPFDFWLKINGMPGFP